MSNLETLLTVYRQMLDTTWMVADDRGLVSQYLRPDKSEKKALNINDRRVVLPTREHLNNVSPDTKYIFHPLTESVMLGESPVIARLRLSATVRVNAVILDMIVELMNLSKSPAEHQKLTPDQQEALSAFKNVKDSYVDVWGKITTAAFEKHGPDHAMYSLFLKMRGRYKDKIHARVGIVTFPLYEELKKSSKPYGITVSDPARQLFLKVLESLIPGIEQPEAYNFGSDSTVAPFLETLFGAIGKIAAVLNELTEKFDPYFHNKDVNHIPMEWAEYIGNLEVLNPAIRLVPPQAGSQGSEKRSDELAREQAVAMGKPAARESNTPPWEEELPAVTSKPAGVPSHGMDFASEMRAAQTRAPQHTQTGGYNPQGAYPIVGQGGGYPIVQQQHNAPQGPVTDFRALMHQAVATGRVQAPNQQQVDNYGRPIYNNNYPQHGQVSGNGGFVNGI